MIISSRYYFYTSHIIVFYYIGYRNRRLGYYMLALCPDSNMFSLNLKDFFVCYPSLVYRFI